MPRTLQSYLKTKDKNEPASELEQEWLNDLKYSLPNKHYKGNCTKEFCNKLIDLYIDREYRKIRKIDFPVTREHPITIDSCYKEIVTMCAEDKSDKTLSNIIRKFHKSIYKAKGEKTLSPYDGWQEIKSDKEKFRIFYANRLRCSDWFNEHDNWKSLLKGDVPEFIYGIGLSTSKKYPCVTYFKPYLAKRLVKTYLNKYETIFDPFSGYSGRLIGSLAAGKNYIGQDLCKLSVSESKDIVSFIKPIVQETLKKDIKCSLSVKDTIKEKGEYNCLFTCPPYQSIEQWPGVKDEGFSCDKWIDICLTNYKCNEYLFVTDNLIDKYKKFAVEELINTSHWGHNSEYVILIKKDNFKVLNEESFKVEV